jgi:hypothetical protein
LLKHLKGNVRLLQEDVQMYRSTTRWTTAVAAAALIALPVAAAAQTTQPARPTSQPRPATTTTGGQLDPAAAKTHLSSARDTLSQLTSMPEAAKLQGEAREQVTQVIANFNELITTQNNWRSTYAKLDTNLTALLGPATDEPAASGVTGAVGTAGAAVGTAGAEATGAAAGMQMEPPVRAKLVEFRKHLKEFEKAAGGPAPTDAPVSGATPTGTSGMTPPPAPAATSEPSKATEQAAHSEADKHLDAISAILDKSKTGALTRAQTTELKKHVAELRALLKQGR